MQIYELLRVQGHSALHGGWDTDSLFYPLAPQTQQKERKITYLLNM
jgi:hypothetical protein